MYKPSKKYWSEVGKLHQDIDRLSEDAGNEKIRRIINCKRRMAQWGGQQESSRAVWMGARLARLGTLPVARLATMELVPNDTSHLDPSAEPDGGLLVTSFVYSCSWMGRELTVGKNILPDIEINYPLTRISVPEEIFALDSNYDITSPTEEAYSNLLQELRRGASGDYAVPVPPH